MLSTLTPTDIAFSVAALMQTVAAVLWWIGGRLIGNAPRATAWLAGFCAASALSFAFLVAAMQSPQTASSLSLRAVGNALNVLSVIALQRGIWLFIDRRPAWAGHLLVLTVLLVISWIGLDPDHGALRVGVVSGLQVAMGLGITRDLYRHGRDSLNLRWPLVLVVPVAVAALIYLLRGLRALLSPEAVQLEIMANSSINIVTAFVFVVATLTLHATLMALIVARLVTDLHRLSRHDGLTGLLNRRAFEEALGAQLMRSHRSAEPFCVMMVDVDHFKRINDQFGHAAGDSALKQLAALMRQHVREVDRVGRFGGEEFVVLLPGIDLATAHVVAQRLRGFVAATPLVYANAPIELSISIGMAQWHGPQEETARLLMRADAALYQAKQRGRNRVVLADAEPALA